MCVDIFMFVFHIVSVDMFILVFLPMYRMMLLLLFYRVHLDMLILVFISRNKICSCWSSFSGIYILWLVEVALSLPTPPPPQPPVSLSLSCIDQQVFMLVLHHMHLYIFTVIFRNKRNEDKRQAPDMNRGVSRDACPSLRKNILPDWKPEGTLRTPKTGRKHAAKS